MDSETRKEFDKMQALIKKPACFGKHGTDIEKCPGCWYHPDCMIETDKTVKTEKPKQQTKKQSKPKQYKSNQSGGKK